MPASVIENLKMSLVVWPQAAGISTANLPGVFIVGRAVCQNVLVFCAVTSGRLHCSSGYAAVWLRSAGQSIRLDRTSGFCHGQSFPYVLLTCVQPIPLLLRGATNRASFSTPRRHQTTNGGAINQLTRISRRQYAVCPPRDSGPHCR